MGTLVLFDPDIKRSKAFPQRTIYVYVNLKGRDPGGIVDPADYEKVQQQIIDALYSYVDPATGKRPVSPGPWQKDARILGLTEMQSATWSTPFTRNLAASTARTFPRPNGV